VRASPLDNYYAGREREREREGEEIRECTRILYAAMGVMIIHDNIIIIVNNI
jgi:hypothetical protein